MPIFLCLHDLPKTCNCVGLIKPCHLLTGLFWDAVDSFAGLCDGLYYIFTGDSTSKADKFDNFWSTRDANLKHDSYTKEPWVRTNAGGRTNFTDGNLSTYLQARFCKLYPADFVG